MLLLLEFYLVLSFVIIVSVTSVFYVLMSNAFIVSSISDTTILSSLASRCQLMRHISTQALYACVPGAFAIIWGTLPVTFGGKTALHALIKI